MTDTFNKENEFITVKLVNQGTYTDLNQKLTAASSGGNLPALAMGYMDTLSPFVIDGKVADLNDYLNNSEIGIDAKNYFEPFLLEGQLDGIQAALPFNKSSEVLIYNATEMKKAGLEVPTTFDKALEVAKAYHKKTGKAGLGIDAPTNLFGTIVNECGIEEWANDKGEFQFTDTCVQDKLKVLQDAAKEGYFRFAGEDKYMSGPFGNGDTLMYIGSSAGTSFVSMAVDGKFDWSVAPAPYKSVVQQGPNIFLFNTVTPEQEFAGYEYIKYMTSDENTVAWAIATGYMPVTNKGLESAEWVKFTKENPTAKALTEQVKNMKILFKVYPGSQEINSIMNGEFMISVIQGKADIKTAIEKFASDAKATYGLNK